ncbi:MAG: hypothetical protein JW900_16040 [Anaerolineae bacterium]|nr:hypothetical protein [Anaerolineae bacterium]
MVIMAVSFFFALVLTGLLWWIAYRDAVTRRFWGLLAAAWTVSIIANVGWGIYNAMGGEGQPGWTDLFYLTRYLLVLLAFWLYPAPWSWRRWAELAIALLATALLLWLGFIRPIWATTPANDLVHVVGGAIYPALDVGLLYAAWYRWRTRPTIRWRNVMVGMLMALLAYSLANWVNYGMLITAPEAESILPDIFWFLSDVLTAIAAWCFLSGDGHAAKEKNPN